MAFVRTSGTNFTLNGRIWTPYGGSVYDFSFPQTHANADAKIAEALSLNLNTIRIVNFFNNQNEGQWQQADYIFDQARLNNLKVLLDLSDFCAYTGGVTGEACYTPLNRQNWYDFVAWLFIRVNTVNGRIYKDDDTIFCISIVGEIRIDGSGADVLRPFFSDVSAAIKATGAQQIVQAGGQIPEIILSTEWTTSLGNQQDMLSISTIDCASTHPYYTQANMQTLFPLLKGYSEQKQKPWFIEEFGYNQTTVKNDQLRSEFTRFVYNIGSKNGAAAVLFWNLDTGFYNPWTGTGGGYGINLNTPLTASIVKQYTKYNGYSPREPVDSVNI